MRALRLVILALALPGCGPLFSPMLPKLGPEDQKVVDQMWDNMLTPVQRVDRTTLLDANIGYWMYAIGVDRLRMTSEKYFNGGKAIMEIECDRANPDIDQFTITVLDDRGRTVRRERYTRSDVDDSSMMMHGLRNVGPADLREAETRPITEPCTTRPATEEEMKLQKQIAESNRRQAAAAAATRPARLDAHHD